MAADTFLDADQSSEMPAFEGNSDDETCCLIETLSDRPHSLRTMLSRELRCAKADYRTLALHAGPLDRITLEAKQLVTRLSALLQVEIERLRSEGREQPG